MIRAVARPGALTAARRSAGLTQAEVGRAVGLSESGVSRIEAGTRGCDLGIADRIASAVGRTLADLFDTVDATRRVDAPTGVVDDTGRRWLVTAVWRTAGGRRCLRVIEEPAL